MAPEGRGACRRAAGTRSAPRRWLGGGGGLPGDLGAAVIGIRRRHDDRLRPDLDGGGQPGRTSGRAGTGREGRGGGGTRRISSLGRGEDAAAASREALSSETRARPVSGGSRGGPRHDFSPRSGAHVEQPALQHVLEAVPRVSLRQTSSTELAKTFAVLVSPS